MSLRACVNIKSSNINNLYLVEAREPFKYHRHSEPQSGCAVLFYGTERRGVRIQHNKVRAFRLAQNNLLNQNIALKEICEQLRCSRNCAGFSRLCGSRKGAIPPRLRMTKHVNSLYQS